MRNTRYLMIGLLLVAATAATARAAEDQDAAAQRRAELVATLKSADTPDAEKAITCKRLAVYGDKEAVPALAPLLEDARLASWARIALEVIPGPEADAALREALGKVEGRLAIGVINSIAVRGDAQAGDALAAQHNNTDADVA